MSIAKEQEVKVTLKAKGTLVAIDDDGLHIEDEKTEDVETLSFDDFEIFNGKFITISVSESVKSALKDKE